MKSSKFKKLNINAMDFSSDVLDKKTGELISPYIDNIFHDDLIINSFPIIYDNAGLIWEEATLFLIHYANTYGAKGIPEQSTVDNMAYGLTLFINWATKNDYDIFYFLFPQPRRPTYQYGAYLLNLIETGKITSNTAIDRFNKVKAFYKWAVDDLVIRKKFNSEFKTGYLWQVTNSKANFVSPKGGYQSKDIESTDISESLNITPNNQSIFCETIEDEGKLRPLNPEEQKQLQAKLASRANIEMSLAHEIAILTGARLSTVFTLRSEDFLNELNPNEKEFKLKIGAGTDIKNKNDKAHTLIFPSNLYYKIRTYALSERYQRRLKKCNSKFQVHIEQLFKTQMLLVATRDYLFIASSGQPFYIHTKLCPYASFFKKPPNGNSVNQFTISISKKLETKYKFHDLRATFGMNLVRSNEKNLESGKITYLELLNYVKERMGHTNEKTTEKYLKFELKKEVHRTAQDSHENEMQEIIG